MFRLVRHTTFDLVDEHLEWDVGDTAQLQAEQDPAEANGLPARRAAAVVAIVGALAVIGVARGQEIGTRAAVTQPAQERIGHGPKPASPRRRAARPTKPRDRPPEAALRRRMEPPVSPAKPVDPAVPITPEAPRTTGPPSRPAAPPKPAPPSESGEFF